MPPADHIEARGLIVEVMPQGAYRVQLANGHRCIARASGEHRLESVRLGLGDLVHLEFHPYDLSRARIVTPSLAVGNASEQK